MFNSFSFSGDTALHLACKHQHSDIVRLLIGRSADVNKSNLDGRTPLHIACENSNLPIITILVEHDADLNAKDNFDNSALHFIAESKNDVILSEDCLKYLLKQKNIDAISYNAVDASPLHVAIVRKRATIAKILIESLENTEQQNAHINHPDIGKMTPLMLAIYGKNVELSEMLLNAGANPNAIIYSDNHIDNNLMPIHIACMSNIPTLIEKLIPLTNISIIEDRLKYSSDKACMFRMCHEHLPENIDSLYALMSKLKADRFLTYFQFLLPIPYPSENVDEAVNQTSLPVFWHLKNNFGQNWKTFPYIAETPLSHFLRNNWQWLNKDSDNVNKVLNVIQEYIKNGSAVNKFEVGMTAIRITSLSQGSPNKILDNKKTGFTLPPLVALCCLGKNFRATPIIAKLFEEILTLMLKKGAKVPRSAVTLICLAAHPIVFKMFCERGVIMVEDINITKISNLLHYAISQQEAANVNIYYNMSIFYYLHFFGISELNSIQGSRFLNDQHFKRFLKEYTIHDNKLDLSDKSLLTNIRLLNLCRVAIRKQIRLTNISRNSCINDSILQLPNLPRDLYSFLCLKTLQIKKYK